MRALLSVLAFAIGFGLVHRAVAFRVPLPPEAGLGSKVDFALEHADDFDVLFVGSSATLYGIRPDVFVEELARLGHPGVRAFNLGVGGMGSFEAVQVLRRLLARDPEQLAWVLYEEPLFDPLLWYPNVYNPRYVHWHDLRSTVDAIGALPLVAAPPDYKRDDYDKDWLGRFDWRFAAAQEHLGLFGWRFAALGEGPRIVDDLLDRGPRRWPSLDDLSAQGGWMDISLDPAPGAHAAHERFAANPAAWQQRVDAIRASAAERPVLEGAYDLDSLRALLDSIRGVGAEPLIYVAPRGLKSTAMSSLFDAGEIPVLFPFHLPDEYPQLAEMSLRWDASHLNAEGAEIWSRLFARAFADHLEATGKSARRR